MSAVRAAWGTTRPAFTEAELPCVNPWHPMTNPRDIKTMGKLGEELGECTSAAARCLIQGIDECEPVSGKSNRVWLMEEIADVLANIQKAVERFDLDMDFIEARAEMKIERLEVWHAMA